MVDTKENSNRRKARTGFLDATGPWYILDNAGTIMPAVSDSVGTSLFRVSATIDVPVNLNALQSALERVGRRFPYFTVELRRGAFWYYFEPSTQPLKVQADADSPSQDFNINSRGTCLFRVRARERRIACEFSHALTDGTGGLRFLKNLLAEYFRIRGVTDAVTGSGVGHDDPDIYDLDETPPHEEYEDAYNRYFTEEYPAPDRLHRAFHLRSPQLPRHQYRITCGIIPLEPALAKARAMGASLTELFAAAYLDAFQALWMSASPRARARQRPKIAVEVPVNMRKFYPTKTNRNFSLFVLSTQDMRLGPRDFPDIVSRVHHQLRFEMDERTIAQQISRNVSGSRNVAVRLVPLWLKDFFAKLLFSALGDDLLSGFVSNLGPVTMPEAYAEHIERFDFLPAPGIFNKTSASVVSWKGNIYFSFGSLATSREIERVFFTRIRSLGLPVRIECNLEAE
jgi:NRPS condensation-like uncharacterized protein